ncbi:MAG: replicative DNA helicase [Rhodospirillales bacterium]|nr:replicative DNA helicase [Alphaproteobacteria bacterium]MBL6947535.1 replicative DNA helicase [Rhodospirillales bacterium]
MVTTTKTTPNGLPPEHEQNAPPGDPQVPDGASPFRTMPHNLEAEKSLLGAIFVNNRAYESVSEFLRPEHFAYPQHGRIYEACTKLIERGQIADPIVLKRYFEADEILADIGGPAYLAELAASAVTVINAGEYGNVIYDLYLKRELIALGEDVVNSAYGGAVDETAVSQIEIAEQSLYDLATSGDYEGGFKAFRESVIAAIEIATIAHNRQGGLAGVGTGFRDLDSLLGGLHPSDLLILAGRPSMGKTALATNMAYNAAKDYYESEGREGAVVGFFSLEMSAEQLASRILSEQSNISSDRMRKGELATEEFNRLSAASTTLHQIPIFIDDTPALTVSALRTRARRLKRQHGLGLIVVDYLQLISGSGSSRNDGRVQEVSEITRGLKTLAKELNVPVLALSQLSRAVEQREPPRPQLSDLRESGSIEQDADVVMFIYREEYYLERKKPGHRADDDDAKFDDRMRKWEDAKERVANLADVIVAKQRHGPIADVKLHFNGAFTRFGDYDFQHDPDR